MAKILKPYEVPLDAELAKEILSIPLGADVGPAPATIGERVGAAIKAVEEANAYLANSKLASLLADTLMRQLKKRGIPTITVRSDGKVMLHIAYDEPVTARPAPPVARKKRKATTPPLAEMRKMADELGVDITDLGQKRKPIYARIQAAQEARAAGIAPVAPDNGITPPVRMVDEQTESDLPPEPEAQPRPRTIRRRAAFGKDPVVEELDVDDLLT